MASQENDSTEKQGKTIRLDPIHWEMVNSLKPFYGTTESEVVRNIVLLWLHDNLGSETINKLQELNILNFKKEQRGNK